MKTEPQPWSLRQMQELARGAVRKVDREGVRGATMCSVEEIVAMAGVLALDCGLDFPPEGWGSEEIEG